VCFTKEDISLEATEVNNFHLSSSSVFFNLLVDISKNMYNILTFSISFNFGKGADGRRRRSNVGIMNKLCK